MANNKKVLLIDRAKEVRRNGGETLELDNAETVEFFLARSLWGNDVDVYIDFGNPRPKTLPKVVQFPERSKERYYCAGVEIVPTFDAYSIPGKLVHLLK